MHHNWKIYRNQLVNESSEQKAQIALLTKKLINLEANLKLTTSSYQTLQIEYHKCLGINRLNLDTIDFQS
jgi:hypothetical protein